MEKALSKVRQRVPGDSLGTGTAAPNSYPAPSAEPRPNLDLLSVGTCICCVCCTSLTSYKQRPSAAVISARLQKSSADHIIKNMNELQRYQRANKLGCLLPHRCPSFALHMCLPGRRGFQHPVTPRAAPAELGWPSRHPASPRPLRRVLRACGSARAADPLFAPSPLAARKAFPPTHQQQVLSLRSNAGTESIPRQMFLRPLTQD